MRISAQNRLRKPNPPEAIASNAFQARDCPGPTDQASIMPPSSLQRYHGIVDDVQAFEEAAHRPLPRFVWANPNRCTPERLHRLLSESHYRPTPLPGLPGAFRINGRPEGLGSHWAYLGGFYHIQEASSMLPVLLLSPAPGHRVLDLCAAPGNKTAQIALAMDNRGTVVANDLVWNRMRPVRMHIDRLGLLNVSISCEDGGSYPRDAGAFDRVLVDAPCSCEGTSRKSPGVLSTRVSEQQRQQLSRKQVLLLQQAIRRCRPGGKIVYSTCTYAPEENEAVIDRVLQDMPGAVRIGEVEISGVATAPGITQWNGVRFDPSLRRAARVWPHSNDTGGFFMAVLEKSSRAAAVNSAAPIDRQAANAGGGPVPSIDATTRRELYNLLETRFGIDRESFEGTRLLLRNRRDIYVVAADHRPPPRIEACPGLPLLHLAMRYPKLTTAGAAAFGRRATRNVVDTDAEQIRAYLTRERFGLSAGQDRALDGDGYVLVRHQDGVLGLGFYRQRSGSVASRFPKSLSPAGR